jgi:hypothetical protein
MTFLRFKRCQLTGPRAVSIPKTLLSKKFANLNMQVLKPVGVGILSIIMIIGIVALITELIEIEEIAKAVVIPSLMLLIAVTGYAMYQIYNKKF